MYIRNILLYLRPELIRSYVCVPEGIVPVIVVG